MPARQGQGADELLKILYICMYYEVMIMKLFKCLVLIILQVSVRLAFCVHAEQKQA